MSKSQYQAKKILESSEFWNSRYGNFNATSEEAQKFLKDNGFIIFDYNSYKKNHDEITKDWTWVATAVVDFDSVNYKSTVPITSSIFYGAVIPKYVDEAERENSPEWKKVCIRRIADLKEEKAKKEEEKRIYSTMTVEEFKENKLSKGAVDRDNEEWAEWHHNVTNPNFSFIDADLKKYSI
jgi:hypothetical protein